MRVIGGECPREMFSKGWDEPIGITYASAVDVGLKYQKNRISRKGSMGCVLDLVRGYKGGHPERGKATLT